MGISSLSLENIENDFRPAVSAVAVDGACARKNEKDFRGGGSMIGDGIFGNGRAGKRRGGKSVVRKLKKWKARLRGNARRVGNVRMQATDDGSQKFPTDYFHTQR